MANDVELNDRRAPYTATSGQTVFDIDFSMENLSDDDLAVYQNGVLLTKTTQYTVDLDASTITLVSSATAGDSVVVEGAAQIVRKTAFPRAGDLRTAILNGDFRRVFFILQEQARDIGRVLLLNSAESDGFNARLPLLQAGKLLGVNAGKTGFSLYDLSDFPADLPVVITGAMSGDVLEYDGTQFVNITREAFKSSLGLKQNNYSATSAPTVDDDSDDGYAVGSKWIDTTNNDVWHCVDATVGAADWELGDLEAGDLGAAAVKGVDTSVDESSTDDDVATALAVYGILQNYTSGTKATQSANSSVSASAWVTISFDDEEYDDGGWHDNAVNNSRVTVDADGRYILDAQVGINNTANGDIGIRLSVNGSAVKSHIVDSDTLPENNKMSITAVQQLTDGDYVEIQVYQSGSGAGTTTQPANCYLAVQRLKLT